MPGTRDLTRLSGVLAAAVFVYCLIMPTYIHVFSPSETIKDSPILPLDSMRSFPGLDTVIFTSISSRVGTDPPISMTAR